MICFCEYVSHTHYQYIHRCLYAVTQCEDQVKRTQVTGGQQHPVWKEDVTFKSVQITSDLQVSFVALCGTSPVIIRFGFVHMNTLSSLQVLFELS